MKRGEGYYKDTKKARTRRDSSCITTLSLLLYLFHRKDTLMPSLTKGVGGRKTNIYYHYYYSTFSSPATETSKVDSTDKIIPNFFHSSALVGVIKGKD